MAEASPWWETGQLARIVKGAFTPPSHSHGTLCPLPCPLLGGWPEAGQGSMAPLGAGGPDSDPGPTGQGGRLRPSTDSALGVAGSHRITLGSSGAAVAGVFPACLKYSLLAGGSKGCFNS